MNAGALSDGHNDDGASPKTPDPKKAPGPNGKTTSPEEKTARQAKKASGPVKSAGVVPNKASEDDPRAWGDSGADNVHDAWLKEQKPPHWG